ncbi:hypothetical protein [Vreelandella utahensis]|uniref:hypothetical protein n=1 Tax=Vreelandella halophila TaxID=86177 RepID=UPI00117B9690|nr:hypothetical protein [Halomonas utahensis]
MSYIIHDSVFAHVAVLSKTMFYPDPGSGRTLNLKAARLNPFDRDQRPGGVTRVRWHGVVRSVTGNRRKQVHE